MLGPQNYLKGLGDVTHKKTGGGISLGVGCVILKPRVSLSLPIDQTVVLNFCSRVYLYAPMLPAMIIMD